MGKDLIQKSLKDSLFTGIIALALFGPIVGLRTVAKNEVLVVEPKWFVVLLIVAFCAVGRFFINIYTYKKEKQYYYLTKGNKWMESSIEKLFKNICNICSQGGHHDGLAHALQGRRCYDRRCVSYKLRRNRCGSRAQ